MSKEVIEQELHTPETASARRLVHKASTPSPKSSSHYDNVSSTLSRTRTKLGLHAQHPVKYDDSELHQMDLLWPKIRLILREPFAEFFGVVIMILFGDGSVAQVLLTKDQTSAPGGMLLEDP